MNEYTVLFQNGCVVLDSTVEQEIKKTLYDIKYDYRRVNDVMTFEEYLLHRTNDIALYYQKQKKKMHENNIEMMEKWHAVCRKLNEVKENKQPDMALMYPKRDQGIVGD